MQWAFSRMCTIHTYKSQQIKEQVKNMGWKRGAVIMEAKPFVHVMLSEFREERCNFCLQGASEGKEIRKCTVCKKLWYCGKDCQKADWKIHKIECRVMRRIVDFLDHTVHLSLRLLIRYLKGEASVKNPEDENPCIRTCNDLMSHSDKITSDPVRSEVFRIMSALLHVHTDGILQLPDDITLLDIFGKVVINSFSISEGMSDVAAGLYVSPSILDHRCWGNAAAFFVGRKLIVRALENIPSGSLADVFMSYVDPLATIQERQEKLQEQYYFTCNCLRCQNTEVDAMMLSVEGSNQGDLARVKDCLEKIDKMKKDKAKPKDILDQCQKCLSAVQLPKNNIFMVRLMQKALYEAYEAKEWKAALKLGKELLPAFSKYYHPYDPCSADLHNHLGAALMRMGQLFKAMPHLNKAAEILSVMHVKVYGQRIELMRMCEAVMRLGGQQMS